MQEVSIFPLFVIPGLTKPALACPVLDTGYLIRGNPVFLSCILAGVYPVLDTTLGYPVLPRTLTLRRLYRNSPFTLRHAYEDGSTGSP
jgi:hypothetical protein